MFSKSSDPTKESTQLKKVRLEVWEHFEGLFPSTKSSKFSEFNLDPIYKVPTVSNNFFNVFIDETECLWPDQLKVSSFFDVLHVNSPFKAGAHCEAKSSLLYEKGQHMAPNNSVCLSSLENLSFGSIEKPFNLAEELEREKNNYLNLSTGQGQSSRKHKFGGIYLAAEANYFNSVSSINGSAAKDSLLDPIVNFSNLELSGDLESHRLYQKLEDFTEILSNDEVLFTVTNESYKKNQSLAEQLPEKEDESSIMLYKSIEALRKAKIIRIITEDDCSSPDDEGPIHIDPGRSFLNGDTASKAKLSGEIRINRVIKQILPKTLTDSDDIILSTIPETFNFIEIPDNSSPILKKLAVICYLGSNKKAQVRSLIPCTGFSACLSVEFSCEESKSRVFTGKENLEKNVWIGLLGINSLVFLEKTKILWLSSGFEHMAACSTSGKVFTWGYGASGCLGHGNKSNLSTPTLVEDLAHANTVFLECGGYHNAAITDDGEVWVWGRGDVNQLAVNLLNLIKDDVGFVALIPMKISELKKTGIKIKGLACGEAHTLLLDSEGTVYSFGWGDDGQLGVEEINSELCLIKNINLVPGLPAKVSKVAAGAIFSACLSDRGQVYVWGNGDQGQLGLGPNVRSSKTPVLVSSFTQERIIDLVCGESRVICLSENGSVFAWGQGTAGFFYDDNLYPFGSEIVCFAPRSIPSIKNVQEYLVSCKNYEDLFE